MANINSITQVSANSLKRFVIMIALLLSANLYGQEKEGRLLEKAVAFMNTNREDKAEKQLLKIIEDYPDYTDAYQALAELYFAQRKYDKAITNYEKVLADTANNDIYARLRLANLYLKTMEYDKAAAELDIIETKLADTNNIKQKKKYEAQADFLKSSLEFRKTCEANPKPFNPVNMGSFVNSPLSEYLPTMTADEHTLLITVLDSGSSSSQNGKGQEDFFFLTFENGQWKQRIKVPYPLNTTENEGAGCISPDGKYIYFTKCNSADGYGSCDIYVSERKGGKWSYPKNLGSNVNTSHWETQPSIASDGRTLYFVSNRPGGEGGSDLYVTKKQRNGSWSKAKNLGKAINTAGDEISPFIHPSNTTLYFSSDSHLTMGGLDILFSRIDKGKFSKPENLGCPINTQADEFGLIVTPSGKQAIYSSDKAGGYGDKDLYIFDLYPEAQPVPITYLKGYILSQNDRMPVEAEIKISDIKTNELVAATISDPIDGSYLLTLPLGAEYALNITAKDFMLYSDNVILTDTAERKAYNKDIFLEPLIKGAAMVLKNVFFAVDSYELLPLSYAELGTLLEILNSNPSIGIEISGHTDNTGSKQHNLTLSEQRAKSVADYLVKNGISRLRITYKGYADEKPIATNDTSEGRSLNRRTEFRIINK
ncbi:MAG: OmpA family protein [Bacteroidales bacterium]|jgi:outer membrane protein OmpA-like peptidoglycan-associated protein|nr:OmpA family protein [Bacteroidales bacterium]